MSIEKKIPISRPYAILTADPLFVLLHLISCLISRETSDEYNHTGQCQQRYEDPELLITRSLTAGPPFWFALPQLHAKMHVRKIENKKKNPFLSRHSLTLCIINSNQREFSLFLFFKDIKK